MKTLPWFAATLVVLNGCNARLQVHEINATASAGTHINGIPFRTKKTTGMTLWQRQSDGSYRQVETDPLSLTLADPDHLYVLGYEGKALSDATLDVTLDKDNTLTKVNLSSTSHASDAITNAAADTKDVSDQIQTNKTAKATKATALQTALLAADTAHAKAEEALLAYQLAQQDPSTTPTDLLAKKDAARAAQLAANESARLAGLPPYYAGVTPYKL